MEARRDILERGILVLMFGQLEKAVASAFEADLYRWHGELR